MPASQVCRQAPTCGGCYSLGEAPAGGSSSYSMGIIQPSSTSDCSWTPLSSLGGSVAFSFFLTLMKYFKRYLRAQFSGFPVTSQGLQKIEIHLL